MNHESKFHAFHWPDHVISKRESRRIREEHNALFNSHAELLEALQSCVETLGEVPCISNKQESSAIQARAAIRKATGGAA